MRKLPLGLVFLATAVCSVLVVAAALALSTAEAVASQADPEFRLGFRALADRIPEVVGQPLEDEHPGPNDTVVQTTTAGMMVWRALDNWTGFTDGARTWVVGPSGVEVRANEDRFLWESHPPLTFDDPFAYCAAVGTVDRMGAGYVGPRFPDAVRVGLAAAMGVPVANFRPPSAGIFLRCYQGQLLACTVGANLNCGQADTSTAPNAGMVRFCKASPESDFIPLYIVGHDGIYSWGCRDGVPEIQKQIFHVDPRGFVAELWHAVQPGEGDP